MYFSFFMLILSPLLESDLVSQQAEWLIVKLAIARMTNGNWRRKMFSFGFHQLFRNPDPFSIAGSRTFNSVPPPGDDRI